jgi:hypothetical protein
VKVLRHGTGPGDADIGRQVRVGTQYPTACAAARLRVEVGNLAAGVYASVGATGADEPDRLGGDRAQGPLD